MGEQQASGQSQLQSPPRFPYVAAVFCAACIVAAAWTMVRYWRCVDVTVAELEQADAASARRLNGSYVRVRGIASESQLYFEHDPFPASFSVHSPGGGGFQFIIIHTADSQLPARREHSFVGRLDTQTHPLLIDLPGTIVIDTTAGRFHGAGFAGLAVGLMGVVVFTMVFRHWLRERRRSREEEAGTGSP